MQVNESNRFYLKHKLGCIDTNQKENKILFDSISKIASLENLDTIH